MRILVTGATGFAGSHLVDSLLADEHDVFALVRQQIGRVRAWYAPTYTPVTGDLLDLNSLREAIAIAQPDVIYHLAGQASPFQSWQIPAQTITINTSGTANLLDAARHYGKPRVIVVTSADIYGVVTAEQMPITEKTPPNPRHPYGISKWAAGQLVPLYWERYGLPVIEARPFNHIGTRQAIGYVVPDFASQLAAIKLGQKEPRIQVGNLSAERDFTDVRDVVRAYRLLAEKGRPGETYLVCSGHPVPIHYLLNTLVTHVGREVEIVYDPARMRPSDVPTLFGSYEKLRRDTGWEPFIHLRESLADALNEWEEHLRETSRKAKRRQRQTKRP